MCGRTSPALDIKPDIAPGARSDQPALGASCTTGRVETPQMERSILWHIGGEQVRAIEQYRQFIQPATTMPLVVFFLEVPVKPE